MSDLPCRIAGARITWGMPIPGLDRFWTRIG